jgi:hypothetical protein
MGRDHWSNGRESNKGELHLENERTDWFV